VESDQKLHPIMNLGIQMPRVVLFFFILINIFLLTSPIAYSANIKGNHVILRTLDKVTAITKDYKVAVGDDLRYGSLTISVKNCQRTPPEEIPETYAFIQIDDLILSGEGEDGKQERIFSGWMLSSSPAASALDHSVYDVWVLACI